MVAEETVNAQVAQALFRERTKRGLTQQKLADLVGMRQPAIARLEDADYGGRTLSTIEKIARALGMRVEVRLVATEDAGEHSGIALADMCAARVVEIMTPRIEEAILQAGLVGSTHVVKWEDYQALSSFILPTSPIDLGEPALIKLGPVSPGRTKTTREPDHETDTRLRNRTRAPIASGLYSVAG
jgi:transcriptional regulator with XRE-family HTH domain